MRSSASQAPPEAWTRRRVAEIAQAAGTKAREISVLYCGDTRMRSLNRRFRRKDRTTDVLAFPAGACPPNVLLRAGDSLAASGMLAKPLVRRSSATPPRGLSALPLSLRPRRARDGHYSDRLLGHGGFLGDIAISVPYASRQASRAGLTPRREIDRLLLHGVLHLMGYDHETDRGEMEALEAKLRSRLGLRQ